MTGMEENEEDRTEFEGRLIHSPVTGLPEKYFPDDTKARLVFGSYMQVLLCMTYVSCVNAGVFYTYAYVSRYPLDGYLKVHPFFTGRFALARVMTNLVLALIIQVTNRVFMPFATRMTVVENHRTETEFEDNLIAKVFVFQFVNSSARRGRRRPGARRGRAPGTARSSTCPWPRGPSRAWRAPRSPGACSASTARRGASRTWARSSAPSSSCA